MPHNSKISSGFIELLFGTLSNFNKLGPAPVSRRKVVFSYNSFRNCITGVFPLISNFISRLETGELGACRLVSPHARPAFGDH